MKLVKPNEKYKDSYYELVNEGVENKDVQEMGNAYRENEKFFVWIFENDTKFGDALSEYFSQFK